MSGNAQRVARKVRGAARRFSDLAYIGQAGLTGFRLRDVHAVRSYDLLRDLEVRFHLQIRTVLYIGANKGQDLPLLMEAYPWATVHCFEPQASCRDALRQVAAKYPGRVRIHQVALTDHEGSAVLRRPANHDQATSLFEPNTQMSQRFPHVTDWQQEEVATSTLDSWAARHELVDDVLVKMDVQGSELLVLRGGRNTIKRVRLVVTELAVIPTYTDAPDMRLMFDELLQLGFGYAGETAQVRDTEAVVVEFDGAFARPRTPALER